MQLVVVTVVICGMCLAGLGLGLLMRRGGLEGSCGGSVEYVEGRFVKKACGTCAKRTTTCPREGAEA